MAVIRPCTVAEIEASENLQGLLQGYAEVSAIPELGEPEPDFPLYRLMESGGTFKAIGLFAPSLVGLATLLIYSLPHYKGRRVATMESFYVLPEHRGGGNGMDLLRTAERAATGLGAKVLMVSAPAAKALEKILPRSGYRPTNTVFMKALA
jgi:GNAT superfamily N-acetyltransferase